MPVDPAAASALLILVALLPLGVRAVQQLATASATRLEVERAANQRAETLLRGLLSSSESWTLARNGYVEVRSRSRPDRVYRIPRIPGIVVVWERGRPICGLCLQPTEKLPDADVVGMHKLMIEGAEDEYLARANHLSVGALYRYGLGVLLERESLCPPVLELAGA